MGDRATQKHEPPIVTGISPKDGVPGTQITIRGENLGHSQADLLGLNICGADCVLSARWESSRKIVARVNQPKASLGDVIVTTRSAGRGTSTVQFRLYNVQIGPLQESAVWVDESRTVPALQRQGTSASNLVDDDPLQIKGNKTHKVTDFTMAEQFPEGSSNIRLENFVAVWFLIESYPNATFEELKAGLMNAQRQSSSLGREGPRDFLKTNLMSFVRCVDALADMKCKLEVDSQDSACWPLGKKVDLQANECASQANKLFADVLYRKERADAARSALSVLQRFKFLFFLPTNIDKHVEKGDYAAVFNDYTRARSLFSDSDVNLFKEAYAQIEKKMERFRKTLEEKLLEMPSNLDDQKKIIRYLLLLKPDSDAGWTCLTASHHWLKGLLYDSQERYYKSAKKSSQSFDEDSDDERFNSELSHRFYFADMVANVLTTKLQPFYKLGQAYVHGQLSTAANLHKEEQIESMVLDVVQLAVLLVQNAVLPQTISRDESEICKFPLVEWPDEENLKESTEMAVNLLHSLKTYRSCVATLLQQDFGSKQLHPLYVLCENFRIDCLSRIVEQSRQSILELQHRENWKTTHDQMGEWSRTDAPELYERCIVECVPLIKQIITNSGYPGEAELLAREDTRCKLLHHLESLLCAFEECLAHMARLPVATVTPSFGSATPSTLSVPSGAAVAATRPSSLTGRLTTIAALPSTLPPLKDRKLLIVLSNCDYALRFSLLRCISRLKPLGARFAEQLREHCTPKYGNLRTNLLKMYIAAKCSPFLSLNDSLNYDEESTIEDYDVSNFIKDLLLCIVSVHAELFLLSPQFTNQVMSFVVRNCSEYILKNVSKKFTENCRKNTQILVDLTAFEDSVQYYLSNDTSKLLEDAKKLYSKNCDRSSFEKALNKFSQKQRFILISLKDPTVAHA